jgi:hypothetical protein
MDQADERLSLHWRSTSHRQEMTKQEKFFAEWLDLEHIPYRYEQLQLIKNNDFAGQENTHGQRIKKHDVQRSVPDFVFQDGEETVLIEITERRRPDGRRPNRRQVDPKKRVRHLARLAQLDCAVIYREELELFKTVYAQCAKEAQLSENFVEPVTILHNTIKRWLEVEWSQQ